MRMQAGYRQLKIGEVRRRTDEFKTSSGTWLKTGEWGCVLLESNPLIYRRRIKKKVTKK